MNLNVESESLRPFRPDGCSGRRSESVPTGTDWPVAGLAARPGPARGLKASHGTVTRIGQPESRVSVDKGGDSLRDSGRRLRVTFKLSGSARSGHGHPRSSSPTVAISDQVRQLLALLCGARPLAGAA